MSVKTRFFFNVSVNKFCFKSYVYIRIKSKTKTNDFKKKNLYVQKRSSIKRNFFFIYTSCAGKAIVYLRSGQTSKRSKYINWALVSRSLRMYERNINSGLFGGKTVTVENQTLYNMKNDVFFFTPTRSSNVLFMRWFAGGNRVFVSDDVGTYLRRHRIFLGRDGKAPQDASRRLGCKIVTSTITNRRGKFLMFGHICSFIKQPGRPFIALSYPVRVFRFDTAANFSPFYDCNFSRRRLKRFYGS